MSRVRFRLQPLRLFWVSSIVLFLSHCGLEPGPIECDSPPCDEEHNGEDPGNGQPPPEDLCDEDPDFVPGEPLPQVEGSWVWVDFPSTRCMDGSSTGLAIHLHEDAPGTLIYLQGGGLCLDATTCSQVANPNGFDESDFLAAVEAGYMSLGAFNREDQGNPFRHFNHVFIPYCSGDLFGGARESGFGGRIHAGLENFRQYLARLVPTFTGEDVIVLAGSSAGAYGATLNYHRTQLAFGCTPVHLVNDSGPLFGDDLTRPCFQSLLRESFGLDAALPEECSDCFGADGGGMGGLMAFLSDRHPERRFALLTTTQDMVIRYFMGYGYSADCRSPAMMPATDFETGVLDTRDFTTADRENMAVFITEGTGHVFLASRPGRIFAEGVSLGAWLASMLAVEEPWESVGP